jgi:Ca-activated chloride channel family protein
MEVGTLHFADPAWLWAALAGPLVLLVAWLRERDGAHALTFPALGRLAGVRRSWRLRLRHLPVVLGALGLTLVALALARPQRGFTRESVTTRGVDIVVALDVSDSMAAEDFQPQNRLAVAKQVVADFVQRRTHDRVGLVVFGAASLTQAPPTTDTGLLLRQLEAVKLEMLPGGTAIGSGLATSLTRLRRSQAKSRIVVLVTDGANNAGEIDPATAADLAKAMEVRVYTVLVGKGGTVPMPMKFQDPFSGRIVTRTVPVEVSVDPALLQRVAERTGGEFFRADDGDALRHIFERIDALEKSEIKLSAWRRYEERFPQVLGAAAALLLLGGLLWLFGLRVLPA